MSARAFGSAAVTDRICRFGSHHQSHQAPREQTATAPASNQGHHTSNMGHKANAAAYSPMPAAKAAKTTSTGVKAITSLRRPGAFLIAVDIRAQAAAITGTTGATTG